MAGNNSFMTSLNALFGDDKFMKDVTSKPCSRTEKVDVEHYLKLAEKILDLEGDQGQSKSLASLSVETPLPLSSTINKLCCQITCEALHTNNARETMASLFDKLSSFSWDAKAVLTLSAFSVYYAENCRLARIEESDNILRSAAMLRGFRAIGKSSDTQRTKAFGALNDLLKVTLEFTKSVVECMNNSKRSPKFSASIDIPASIYHIIVVIFGCSVQFSGMISMGNEFQGLDMSTFSNRLLTEYQSFKKEIEKKFLYQKIKELSIFGTDIVELMAKLFCTENDLTVYQCSKRTTVEVKELKNKTVMLLISNLNLSNGDLAILTSIYHASTFKSCNYEIMWVPVVEDYNEAMQQQFLAKRSQMKWYACNSVVSNVAAEFIKKKWQFRQQTQVVVLNQRGMVENIDAMTMIRLWGPEALPFTQERGCKLWEGHRDNWLKLVLNDTVFQYVEQSWEKNQLIFLYGSAEDSQTVEQIGRILNTKIYASFKLKFFNINTEGNQFLSRLENCISWKMQVNKEKPDFLSLKLLELYTSYKNRSGLFAIVERGSSVIVNASLTDLSKKLSEPEQWIKKVTNTKDFDTHFQEHFTKVVPRPPCYQFSIPNMVGNIPECIKCSTANCRRNMETVVTFKCCHGAH